MKDNKILDKNITDNNYGTFKRCSIIHSGKMIRFNMTGGASYCVPIDYFLSWYTEPHSMYLNGKWIDWNSSKRKSSSEKDVTFVKCRCIMSKHAVKVYLSNNTAYVVPWDTVLMSCEKKYEHFGGLTSESKRLTRKFHKAGKRCFC